MILPTRPDFVVVGGGILGLSIALELKRRGGTATRVAVLEKEPQCGMHASGRNSGVLHSGIYYESGSLKANLTQLGNRRMREFCAAHGVPINDCGKLLLARSERDLERLQVIRRRAEAGSVPFEQLAANQVHSVEPLAVASQGALFSPTTATVEPTRVIHALEGEAAHLGVCIARGVQFIGRDTRGIRTQAGRVTAGFLVNAGGAYADVIAKAYGFGDNFRILPFRGLYLAAPKGAVKLRTNVYSVPNLDLPFLGVHLTVGPQGDVKVGPTALPALWREQYGRLRGLRLKEFVGIGWRHASLMFGGDGRLRANAVKELRKVRKTELLRHAAQLVVGLPSTGWTWQPPGIRAQLVNRRTGLLEMDFVLEGDDRSMHVLNAVSPGFTSALAFAEHVVDRIRIT